MDQALKLKLKDFEKTTKTLEEALKSKKDKITRDSVIKRFEYTFEICWKTAKLFLRERHGVDAFSPKEVFRSLRSNGLISAEETEILLKMTNDRNEIVHTYNESFADELENSIRDSYFKLLKKIFKELKNSLK